MLSQDIINFVVQFVKIIIKILKNLLKICRSFLNDIEVKKSKTIYDNAKIASEVVTILACVTRKVLGKEVLGHLGGVGQYYR